MAQEAVLIKFPDVMKPATEVDADQFQNIPDGSGIRVRWVRQRHLDFHRKFFALLQTGFEGWEVRSGIEYQGTPVEKNFDRYRKDVIVLAGYYEPVFDMAGAVRLEAKSISFSNMDEDEFAKLYSAVLDVILEKVLRNYTIEEVVSTVNERINKILGFS